MFKTATDSTSMKFKSFITKKTKEVKNTQPVQTHIDLHNTKFNFIKIKDNLVIKKTLTKVRVRWRTRQDSNLQPSDP